LERQAPDDAAIENSKFEYRNPEQFSQFKKFKSKLNSERVSLKLRSLVILILFELRASDFVLRTLVSNRRFDSGIDIVTFGGVKVGGNFASPGPAADLGRVLAMLVNVFLMIDKRVADRLLGIGRPRA
jgi:hypothetical protein